jgi:general secretion pathway protein I
MNARPTAPGRRLRAASAARGFTLIEVLVAVAIVAVALAAGSRAASSVTDTSQRLSDVTLAQWCADNELTELRLTATFPNVGTTPFDCTELGRAFKGTLKTQPTPNPSFRRVDTIVADETGRTLLTISTVVSR